MWSLNTAEVLNFPKWQESSIISDINIAVRWQVSIISERLQSLWLNPISKNLSFFLKINPHFIVERVNKIKKEGIRFSNNQDENMFIRNILNAINNREPAFYNWLNNKNPLYFIVIWICGSVNTNIISAIEKNPSKLWKKLDDIIAKKWHIDFIEACSVLKEYSKTI